MCGVSTTRSDCWSDILLRGFERVTQQCEAGRLNFFHNDNAPATAAFSVCHFLAKNELLNAHYQSDLAPCDFFMFSRIKRDMKGQCFDNVENVK